ncbi:4Fe-4S dicluster domain-containing protein [Sinorhizobium alkalisoli]|uniref:Ferredoxin n=1 Tax=Sinorhizobium alkalisoli TaxID=1752398 RepID=A0A1E3VC59_9HYPH|nr:4Fe-4S dicluster domain-containing protein [Sinorhizobium alkalisoli]MCA1494142.1 4Fe-4S dicluster domain-containing protein [Ensifer sp. NBAIM29]MCG5479110.1 4Fe-4S dicluster domain-containing protein [Sinorhizobium alkalisoli]ODR91162.1 ferredoxin [Sinorhizobium alkalisoli]QFI66780.1 Ferredoxin [Sinorhizobium alkalisoli]
MTAASASAEHSIEKIRAALRPHGLFLRGTVTFAKGEEAPSLDGGAAAASVALIGNIGGSIWEPFSRWREGAADAGGTDPLDNWSKQVILPVAEATGVTAYFPSDPPWQPFQQWAMRAEGLKQSPLGILIHPRFGLWHGYRGALAFARPLPVSGEAVMGHPCDTCEGKPCVAACPAQALASGKFDAVHCRTYLGVTGRGGCFAAGCRSRNACPVGWDYRYPVEQLQFHMAALSF